MAERRIHRLSAVEVNAKKAPGLYADGGGLYLQVIAAEPKEVALAARTARERAKALKASKEAVKAMVKEARAAAQKALDDAGYVHAPRSLAKSWLFRYQLNHTARAMGLGSLLRVPLATARKRAQEARELLGEGKDPLEVKRSQKASARVQMTFRQCADKYIKAHRSSWRNDKHAEQWENTLATYVHPILGGLNVGDIDEPLIEQVLAPIWTEKAETAGRIRGRIEAILDWAKAAKLRTGENPARWKGNLEHLLAKPKRKARIVHHAALPYAEIGDFMAQLRDQSGTSARALEFAILTAARTGEVIGATWGEVNLDGALWTIPAARMKGGREHRIPLAPQALNILRALDAERDQQAKAPSDPVFPGRAGALSNMSLLAVLKRMKRGDLTTHGFRSTFRDWTSERTSFPREVAEMALAHAIGDAVEAAYRRGELMDKRKKLAEAWGSYCALPSIKSGDVLTMKRKG
jgi:integrase